MQIKVAIVDDDEGRRTSLAALIRRNANFRLAGDYPNAETALKEIPRHPPDVVLTDINLPAGSNYAGSLQMQLNYTDAPSMTVTQRFYRIELLP